jgi:hypothetical protein
MVEGPHYLTCAFFQYPQILASEAMKMEKINEAEGVSRPSMHRGLGLSFLLCCNAHKCAEADMHVLNWRDVT